MKINDLKDKSTQELLHGMFILLEAYPQAKVRVGYDQDILIEGIDDKLPEEDKKLLENYGWKGTCYSPVGEKFKDYITCFWEYSMKHKG